MSTYMSRHMPPTHLHIWLSICLNVITTHQIVRPCHYKPYNVPCKALCWCAHLSHTDTHRHTQTHRHRQTQKDTHRHMQTHADTHRYTDTHTHTHARTRARARTHARTHARTCLRMLVSLISSTRFPFLRHHVKALLPLSFSGSLVPVRVCLPPVSMLACICGSLHRWRTTTLRGWTCSSKTSSSS